MKYGFIKNLPNFGVDVYNVIHKPGSRVEYSLTLTDELKDIGSRVSDLPLRFASIVHAQPSDGPHQQFHADDNSGERAIVYLTDVSEETNGPIEFEEYGKVLGKAGTFIKYAANEVHRGCASDIDRYALALAFDEDAAKVITTVGSVCTGYECPDGYTLKDPIVDTGSRTTENCCVANAKKDYLWIVLIVVALFVIFALFNTHYFLSMRHQARHHRS